MAEIPREDWWKHQNLRKAEILLTKYMGWELKESGEAYFHRGVYINTKDYTLEYAETNEDPFPGAQAPSAKVKAAFQNICNARGKRGNSSQKSFSIEELKEFKEELDKVNVNLFTAMDNLDRNADGSISFEEFKKAFKRYSWVKEMVDSIVFADPDPTSSSSSTSTVDRHAKPLTEAEETRVKNVFQRQDEDSKIKKIESYEILVKHFQRLNLEGKESGWLNDEIINVCMEMLQQRELKGTTSPRVYFVNSLFNTAPNPKIYGRKWFKNNNLSELQWLIFPANQTNFHWWSYYVDLNSKTIYDIDSMRKETVNEDYLKKIQKYLKFHRFAEEKEGDFKVEKLEVPSQNNGSDCGVFTVMFAVYFTDPKKFGDLNVLQKVQPNLCNSLFRKRIGLYILNGRID